MPAPGWVPPLTHLRRLTDDTGLLQHARYHLPDPRHGYTLDDNSRALAVAVGLQRAGCDTADLVDRYLSFIVFAQRPDGHFHNFLSYDRRWLDDRAGDDALGHVIAALGYAAARSPDRGVQSLAAELLRPALTHLPQVGSPRGIAHGLLGVCWMPTVEPAVEELGNRLIALHHLNRAPGGWEWFESLLAYDNGRLPLALLVAGKLTGESSFTEVARCTLNFLLDVVCPDGMLDLVGNQGWFPEDGSRAQFDQQPVDAASMAEVCAAADQILGGGRYRPAAETSARWFEGANRIGIALAVPETGGCHDGLEPEGVNANQGAESTLALFQARLALHDPGWVVPGAR